MSFVITQATIDKQVLEFIQEILGFGRVIPQSAITSRYVTQNKKEIDIIISLFNGNLVLLFFSSNFIEITSKKKSKKTRNIWSFR